MSAHILVLQAEVMVRGPRNGMKAPNPKNLENIKHWSTPMQSKHSFSSQGKYPYCVSLKNTRVKHTMIACCLVHFHQKNSVQTLDCVGRDLPDAPPYLLKLQLWCLQPSLIYGPCLQMPLGSEPFSHGMWRWSLWSPPSRLPIHQSCIKHGRLASVHYHDQEWWGVLPATLLFWEHVSI